ncbi:hypothetical protein [Nonomuraea sp. NPDC003709]|uniref:hypothetical protein n=1 Tax=Nonomuraea sp. NPDC003709 TaxID=3154450 RepID=UPI0033BEB513
MPDPRRARHQDSAGDRSPTTPGTAAEAGRPLRAASQQHGQDQERHRTGGMPPCDELPADERVGVVRQPGEGRHRRPWAITFRSTLWSARSP